MLFSHVDIFIAAAEQVRFMDIFVIFLLQEPVKYFAVYVRCNRGCYLVKNAHRSVGLIKKGVVRSGGKVILSINKKTLTVYFLYEASVCEMSWRVGSGA